MEYRTSDWGHFLMTSNSAIDATAAVNVAILSVSANEDDHLALRLTGHSRWMMVKAGNLSEARALLSQKREISVIVCDCDTLPGAWIAILDDLLDMPAPPSLIVTSRLADDRLWAEALNLGAWDVLAKPLDPLEALRSVRYACDHWQHHAKVATEPPRVMSAAS
jgi:DNA-binding NtrC family response regulator